MSETQREYTELQGQKVEHKSEELPKAPDSVTKSAEKIPIIKEAERKDKEVEKKLSYMGNKEFLSISRDDRLSYITNPEKDYKKVNSWDSITFTFSFVKEEWNELSKELNHDLYLKTTAWQVLPPEVKEVTIWWEIYTRENLLGEFFTPDNKRLTIHEWTTIQIWKLRSKVNNKRFISSNEDGKNFEDDIDSVDYLMQKNQEKVTEFIKNNPNSNENIVREAINRWIDPKIAQTVFWDLIKSKTDKDEIRVILEDAFTEYDRMRDYNNVSSKEQTWKNFLTLILELLMKFNPSNWKELAKTKLNIDESSLKSHENSLASNNERAEKIKSFNKLDENKSFKENAINISKEIEKIYWIPWKITVAQAALESNWGKSKLSTEWNNYFWIKSFWKWPSVNFNTQEVVNWKTVTVNDWFKAFWDMKDSFIGYANFLTKNQRYRSAFNFWADINPKPEYYSSNYQWYDPEKFASEIAKAWYATDPNYYQKIVSISRGLNDNVS